MKKISTAIIALILALGCAITTLAAGDPMLGRLLGDISRGNHPLAGLDGTDIIVPRPAKSKYEPIAVLDTSKVQLTDIGRHWAEANIRKFVQSGYIAGYEDGTFRPDNPVNYAEFVTIVARMGLRPVRFDGGFKASRYGLPETAWFYNAFFIAAEAGIFGNPDDSYLWRLEDEQPTDDAKRQYVAFYLANMIEYVAYIYQLQGYSDASEIDVQVINPINCMVFNGIIKGYPDGTFKPNGTITRAELVAMLTRILDKYNWDMLTIHDNLYGNYYAYFWEQAQTTVRLTNEERRDAGLNELRLDPNLQALAEIKAIDFIVNGYFAHESSVYGNPQEMSQKFGYIPYVGENIAGSYMTGESAYLAWKKSDAHHKNYMKEDYSLIGVALNTGGAVEIMGTP